jgi:hypothetical protein
MCRVYIPICIKEIKLNSLSANTLPSRIEEAFRDAFDSRGLINARWASDRKLIIVPVMTDDVSMEEWTAMIVRGTDYVHAARLYFALQDEVDGIEPLQVIESSYDALFRFCKEFSMLRYAVLTDGIDFIACSMPPNGLGLICGSSDSVDKALGSSAADGLALFRRAASKYQDDSTPAHAFYMDIADRYSRREA